MLFLEVCLATFLGLSNKKNVLELSVRNLLKNALCGHGCVFLVFSLLPTALF